MRYFLLIFCMILCSCSSREEEAPVKTPAFYFDEEKFQSEWNLWKSQDMKDYSFTLKGELPYWLYSKAKYYSEANYSEAILMYDYEVRITVKNGVMDSFEYIGTAPSEHGSIVEPEYTSLSDMYQKIYEEIKNDESDLSKFTNGCLISIRYEIEYNQEFHNITSYNPIYEMDNYNCEADILATEASVSDFLKN